MNSDVIPIVDENEQSKAPARDWRLFNIIVLGFSFMFMFTSFQTCSMAEVIINLLFTILKFILHNILVIE